MSTVDDRPSVWVGHITLHTNCLNESETFMQKIGMRPIFRNDEVAVLELRGGTHVLLLKQDSPGEGNADFDLMVEDLNETHHDYAARGLEPSEVARGDIHDSFTIRDPGGMLITVNSTHVSDQPV
ncbi:MAG: VOC family protein [Gammaproteobacteria bacterium]|nr:VOC family protein [Gammaproteobacteria bacterium]